MDRREFLVFAAAVPFLARAAPQRLARLHGGTPLALVTADTEAHVVAVALATGRIRRRIATIESPRSIESAAGRVAVIAHTTEGAVTLLDGRSLEVQRVLRGFSRPRYTAVEPRGRLAYVSDSGRGEIVVLDVSRGRVLHRTEVGGPARHISLDPSGRWLWTALGTKAQELAVLDAADPRRPRLVHRVRPPFLAHDVGISREGRRVWVTSGDRGAIVIFDRAARRIVRRLAAGAPPQHVAFGAGVAYVTSGDDGTLRTHALRSGRTLGEAHVPAGSYNVTTGWGRVCTPSLDVGSLVVCDSQGRPVRRLHVADAAHDACFVIGA